MLSIMLVVVAAAALSGSDEPLKHRDLRYRPNNGYAYQYTSVHNGNRERAASAFSYQLRLEQFHDEKRVPVVAAVRSIPAVPAPVSVAVVAVGVGRRPAAALRFPSRSSTGTATADRRHTTTVDMSDLTKKLAGHSHVDVVWFH